MGKPTGFMEITRQTSLELPPEERIRNFNEFHVPLHTDEQQAQGARCMDCGVPFCQSGVQLGGMFSGCPLNNLIPEWNDLVYQGKWDLAVHRLIATNRYPEFTSRVCPALCEAACTCGNVTGDPVTVKENERAIVEYGYESGAIHAVPPPARTGKTVAVIGIGVSNTPLLELLLAEGIRVTACDKRSREQMGEQAEHLEQLGCELHLGADYLKDLDADVIFRTPGLRPDVPEISACVQKGAVLTSEMEVFFRICPCPIIAVTGSDGKTTTTTIIAELLKKAGKRVWVGGNIGHPLLCEADGMLSTDFAVLELSSFQLMTMTQSPHIAVVTNLAPNHLDVHRDMAEYVAAKENIFTHQSREDIAIFNADNAITAEQSTRAPGHARLFSRQGEVADGVFLRGELDVPRCLPQRRS